MDKQREPVGSWKDPGSSNCRQCLLPQGQETRRGLGIVKTQRLGGSSPLSCTQTSEKTPGVWVPGLALESALWPPRADEATLVHVRKPAASYCHYPGQGQPLLSRGEATCKAVQVGSKQEEASPFFLLQPQSPSAPTPGRVQLEVSWQNQNEVWSSPVPASQGEHTRGFGGEIITPQPGRGGQHSLEWPDRG